MSRPTTRGPPLPDSQLGAKESVVTSFTNIGCPHSLDAPSSPEHHAAQIDGECLIIPTRPCLAAV